MPAPYIPGEVLVRFAAGSAGAAAVAAALGAAPPDFALLNPAVESLHARTQIPLKAIRPAGGNDILVQVDAERLAERTAARLRTGENVDRVSLMPTPAPGPILGGVRTQGFVVAFKEGSPQAACISKTGGESRAPDRCNPAAELSQQLAIPLRGEVHDGQRLRVEIDMPALTRVLVERLNALGDIESAQPNYIMGIGPAM